MTDSVPQDAPVPPPEGGSDSRGWGVAAHLAPWIAGFVGPLIVWLAKKEDRFVEDHAREALNFQLSLMPYVFGSAFPLILAFLSPWLILVTMLLFFGLGAIAVVTAIVGAVRASNGDMNRYPLSIRFVSQPNR
jgi:uncharacterized Tic20 family protein